MPIPTIILDKPYVLVSLQDSPQGIEPLGNTNFVFGYVEHVYDTCDKIEVGNYIYFDNSEQSGFSYENTIYYLIQDNKILFKEDYIPPL